LIICISLEGEITLLDKSSLTIITKLKSKGRIVREADVCEQFLILCSERNEKGIEKSLEIFELN
jgi:hypothetical protein